MCSQKKNTSRFANFFGLWCIRLKVEVAKLIEGHNTTEYQFGRAYTQPLGFQPHLPTMLWLVGLVESRFSCVREQINVGTP